MCKVRRLIVLLLMWRAVPDDGGGSGTVGEKSGCARAFRREIRTVGAD